MRFTLAIVAAILLAILPLRAEEPPAKKVLIIGIDGCRTDALKVANAPYLHKMMDEGAFASNTLILGDRKSDADTVSGPGWSNILCGVWPDKHGVTNNQFKVHHYEEFPCLFTHLKEVRPNAFTASVVDWPPIHDKIISSADINELIPIVKKDYAHADALVADKAVEILKEKNPDALFVYFGSVDETGHAKTFDPATPEYVHAIENVDSLVGTVLKAMQDRPSIAKEDWLVIVCTDHGGKGNGHGNGHNLPEIKNVFLIVYGASAAKEKLPVQTYHVDIVATALAHLGIALKKEWLLDGNAVGIK